MNVRANIYYYYQENCYVSIFYSIEKPAVGERQKENERLENTKQLLASRGNKTGACNTFLEYTLNFVYIFNLLT